jgi:cysteine dioxygenase
MAYLENTNPRGEEGSNTEKDLFGQLVQDLGDALRSSSGLESEDVDLPRVLNLMETYQSNEAKWQRYAIADHSRHYTRNLVSELHRKANLFVVVWTPGRSSAIHDLAGAHCLMRILKVSLKGDFIRRALYIAGASEYANTAEEDQRRQLWRERSHIHLGQDRAPQD